MGHYPISEMLNYQRIITDPITRLRRNQKNWRRDDPVDVHHPQGRNQPGGAKQDITGAWVVPL